MRFLILLLGCVSLAVPIAAADGTPPIAPPMEMSLTDTPDGLQLDWSAPADNASIDGYRVYRSDGGPFVAIHNTTDEQFLDPEGTLGNTTELGHLYYATAFSGQAGSSQQRESAPSTIVGDWPRCWDVVGTPGPMGLPVGVRLNCYLPVPFSAPCPSISIEQLVPPNPLSPRDPVC